MAALGACRHLPPAATVSVQANSSAHHTTGERIAGQTTPTAADISLMDVDFRLQAELLVWDLSAMDANTLTTQDVYLSRGSQLAVGGPSPAKVGKSVPDSQSKDTSPQYKTDVFKGS